MSDKWCKMLCDFKWSNNFLCATVSAFKVFGFGTLIYPFGNFVQIQAVCMWQNVKCDIHGLLNIWYVRSSFWICLTRQNVVFVILLLTLPFLFQFIKITKKIKAIFPTPFILFCFMNSDEVIVEVFIIVFELEKKWWTEQKSDLVLIFL